MASLWSELDTMQIQLNRDTYECPICDSHFTSPIQLTVHCIALHRAVPCVHCLKLFESEQSLDDHTRTQHACQKHLCAECSDEFSQQIDFETHMHYKHLKKLCNLCGLLTSIDDNHLSSLHKIDDTSFKISLSAVSPSEFRCCLCADAKIVKRLDKLLLHYLYFHKCSLQSLLQCILSNNSMESLRSQVADHDDVHAKCSICCQTYTWPVPKVYHKIYCHGFIYCATCANCFDTQTKFDDHMSLCHKKTSTYSLCDNCGNSSNDDDRPHLETVHKITTTTSINQISSLLNADDSCTLCLEKLNCKEMNLNEMINHFRSTHNLRALAILSYLKPGKHEKQTEQCDDKRARENFTEIRTIDGDESVGYIMHFDTKLVKYVYSSASDYDSNDSDDENGTRSTSGVYQCDVCDFRCRSKFVHVMHVHKKHGFSLKKPEFRCNVCRKVFTSNRSLRKHNQNSHHKQTNGKRFNCPFCTFGTNGKTKIRQHIAEHVESSYHPCTMKNIGFNCRYCHFIFWTKEKLSEHQLSRHSEHLQDSYLLCSLCFSAFNNLSTLRSHNATRHFEFSLDGHAFQCDICRIVLFSIDAIRFHMQEMHPNFESMCCSKEKCMQMVSDEEELRAHWATQHTKIVYQCLDCFKMFERQEFVENHLAVTHATSKMAKSQ